MILLLIIFSLAFAAEKPDPSTCAYWYHRLEEISMYEELKLESDRIAKEENPYAAMDYVEDLNRRIRAIQKKIEEDNK